MPTPTLVTTKKDDEIAERTTPTLEFDFLDENGDILTGNPTTAVMTLYNKTSNTVINERKQVNVIGSVTAGHLSFKWAIADMVLIDESNTRETHVVMIEYTWAGGASAGKHEIELKIKNMSQVNS